MWLRLRQIALVAAELQPVLEDFRAVLGLEVCYVDPGVKTFGLENSLMPVGNQFIEVVAPIQEGTTAGRYLERRGGNGGYMVITQCDDHAGRIARVEQLGVRRVFGFENDEYRCMQLHPKDTGGSFFEIDEQVGPRAQDADGPWDPAGGDGWKAAQRLERVSAISAAELQSDDPVKLARRWAEIAELPVGEDAGGNPVVELDNATLRFVTGVDGRGEGLAGIDVVATDKAAILAAAAARGAPVDGDRVLLGGMRVNLR
jgi:hypothetical protein